MAWQDDLIPASFRGVPFKIEAHEAEAAGRRLHVHEYPGRDEPYPEDLGKKTKEFEVTAYVIGDDYFAQRDALVDACDQPGAGALDHPYLGSRRVMCGGCKVSESTREGRMARVTMTFVDAGANRYPAATVDTGVEVEAAAQAADALMLTRFEQDYAV